MTAPNVIFVDDLAIVNDCVTKISLKQLPNFSEYVRKDVLLEWLNRMFDISAQSFEFQRNYAYGKVIDKLNSM